MTTRHPESRARSRFGPAAAALLALAAALLVAAPATAVTGWSGPTRVLAEGLAFGTVGVDAAGFVHVVASDQNGLLYRTNKPSGTWHSVRIVSGEDINPSDVSVGVSSNGHVFVAWAPVLSNGITNQNIYYITNANGGPNHGWPTTSTLLVTGNVGLPALKLLNGNIHLAYVKSDLVHYMTNQSGSWVSVKVSSIVTDGSVSLAVDASGMAHLAWGDLSEIKYAVNVGSTSSPSFHVITIPGTGCRTFTGSIQCYDGPALALDNQGHPHVAFGRFTNPTTSTAGSVQANGDGLYYAVFNGTSWTPKSKRKVLSGELFSGPWLVLNGHAKAHILTSLQNVVEVTNASGSFQKTTLVTGQNYGPQSLALDSHGKPAVLLGRCCNTATQGLYLMQKQ
jgi:hypothetical protein